MCSRHGVEPVQLPPGPTGGQRKGLDRMLLARCPAEVIGNDQIPRSELAGPCQGGIERYGEAQEDGRAVVLPLPVAQPWEPVTLGEHGTEADACGGVCHRTQLALID